MTEPNTITGFDSVTTPNANSVLWIVTWPFGVAADHQITLTDLFANITTNVITTGNLSVGGNTSLDDVSANNIVVETITTNSATVNSNGIVITEQFTPANSTILTVPVGKIFYDDTYLYVTTATGVIKRISLGSF